MNKILNIEMSSWQSINGTINGKNVGYWEHYWPNGEIESEGYYVNGKRHGYWIFKYDNGKVKNKGNYDNDVKEGLWQEYYGNEKLYTIGHCSASPRGDM